MTELEQENFGTIYKYTILGKRLQVCELQSEEKSKSYRVLCYDAQGRETTSCMVRKNKEGVVSAAAESFFLTERDDNKAKKIAIEYLDGIFRCEEIVLNRKYDRMVSVQENEVVCYDDKE